MVWLRVVSQPKIRLASVVKLPSLISFDVVIKFHSHFSHPIKDGGSEVGGAFGWDEDVGAQFLKEPVKVLVVDPVEVTTADVVDFNPNILFRVGFAQRNVEFPLSFLDL